MGRTEFDKTTGYDHGSSVHAKLRKSLKAKALPVLLSACALTIGIATTGCGGNNGTDINKTRDAALASINVFLTNAKECKNFTSVSERSYDKTYTYYADADKIKIEYGTTISYGVIEEGYIYEITRADDMSWHKNASVYGIDDPEDRMRSLISKIENVPWNGYDKKTKTLTSTLNDGTVTAKLDGEKLTVNIIADDKTTTFIIKDVGTTAVTLPEGVIDDA